MSVLSANKSFSFLFIVRHYVSIWLAEFKKMLIKTKINNSLVQYIQIDEKDFGDVKLFTRRGIVLNYFFVHCGLMLFIHWYLIYILACEKHGYDYETAGEVEFFDEDHTPIDDLPTSLNQFFRCCGFVVHLKILAPFHDKVETSLLNFIHEINANNILIDDKIKSSLHKKTTRKQIIDLLVKYIEKEYQNKPTVKQVIHLCQVVVKLLPGLKTEDPEFGGISVCIHYLIFLESEFILM